MTIYLPTWLLLAFAVIGLGTTVECTVRFFRWLNQQGSGGSGSILEPPPRPYGPLGGGPPTTPAKSPRVRGSIVAPPRN